MTTTASGMMLGVRMMTAARATDAEGDDRPMREANGHRARMRALVVPREHGAWGLLLVPLVTGAAAGLRSGGRILPTLLFALVAVLLFWLRTPVESLMGSGVIVARTREERRVALLAAGGLAVVAAGSLVALLWGGRNLLLMAIGGIAGLAFLGQAGLRKLGREVRMASQMVGAFGLTAMAPAAYYVASGRMNRAAMVLWAANWLFAANQIHFVQLRIHGFRADCLRAKMSEGKYFLAGQALLVAALGLGIRLHVISWLVMLAFTPVLVRGTRWFFQAVEALNVKALGWSEMRQGVVFGVLLTLALMAR